MVNDMEPVGQIHLRLEDMMPLIRESLQKGQPVRFSPKGTSMLPMLRQGIDSVVLSPLSGTLKKYDLPLYQRQNGQYVLHRIVRTGDTYSCIGDNQFDVETCLRQEQMIAVVTAFSRGDREYSVADFRYQLYCRIWHHSRKLRWIARRLRSWLRRFLR